MLPPDVVDRGVRTADWHTGGEPFRIVADSPAVAGATVAERRLAAMADPQVDDLRALLCSEPRGHADMYGGFLVPPDDAGAHLGVLFWHKDGFSTACGHGSIALGAWAVRTGRVPEDPSGTTDVVIDVPSGRVTARVRTTGGRVEGVDFVSVPSFVLHHDVEVETSRGRLALTTAYGGAVYAHVRAADAGLRVAPSDLTDLIALAREVKAGLAGRAVEQHPTDPRLSGTYGVVFWEDQDAGADEPDVGVRQRNVTVFADGEVDRSPCGSGTASRVAVLAASGALGPGRVLRHESVVGSVFHARVGEVTTLEGPDGPVPAVVPVVSGTAHPTGEHHFTVDPGDDLVPGFVLR